MSRFTDFPFDSKGYPVAAPVFSLGTQNHWKSIIRKQSEQDAKKEIIKIPSEIGVAVERKHREYEFTNYQGENIFRGDPITLLKFIIKFVRERYDVTDRNGNGWVTQSAKEAVEYLRNALPPNWHRSIRGSAEDVSAG